MDTHISSWILEFVLSQRLDDWITCRLISVLPPSDSNLRLKKIILLRRISSLLSNFSISESILKTLEIIEEIDHSSGTKSPKSMKKAYSSVAVDCAAKFLRQEPEDYGSFADAVNRVWKGRIGAMRRWRGGGVGIMSDELRDMEREMLAAVENPPVRRRLRERDTRKDALESLKTFLEEAAEEMGPPFLELAAKTLFGKEGFAKDFISFGNWNDCRVSKKRALGLSENDDHDVERGGFEGVNKKSNLSVVRKGSLNHGEKDVSNGVIISEKDPGVETMEEVGTGAVQDKYDILSSVEVAKVQEALKSSSADLHAAVCDPLPDALEFAMGVLCNMGQNNQKGAENNKNQLDVETHNSAGKGTADGRVGEIDSGKEKNGKLDGTSWPGFMAWNKTAHTYEWDDDSIDSPQETSPNVSRKLRLPSPEKKMASPLKKYEGTRFSRRRKIKKWSLEEEQTLREAVEKYGKGNWKIILERYPAIFEERTTIDLKDKWRNMIRG